MDTKRERQKKAVVTSCTLCPWLAQANEWKINNISNSTREFVSRERERFETIRSLSGRVQWLGFEMQKIVDTI